jgi:hypothetical protein
MRLCEEIKNQRAVNLEEQTNFAAELPLLLGSRNFRLPMDGMLATLDCLVYVCYSDQLANQLVIS